MSETHEPTPPRAGDRSADLVIETRELTKVYRKGLGRRTIVALSALTLEVRRGDAVGFLGHNGAGKSTTIKLLAGLLAPTRGTARLFGEDPTRATARRRIGYLPENPALDAAWTPREFLAMSARLFGLPRIEARRELDRLAHALAFTDVVDRPIRKLSKGQVQIVGVAHALLGTPELLILDEPLSGLDPLARRTVGDLLQALKERGCTIFFSSHVLADVERLCDRVGIIRQGRFLGVHELDAIRASGAVGAERTLEEFVLARLGSSTRPAPSSSDGSESRRRAVGDEP